MTKRPLLATTTEPLSLPQPYQEVSHTADLSIRVTGETKAVVMARLVLAMGHLLAGGEAVEPEEELWVRAEPADLPMMAVDILRELLYLFATKERIPAQCGVEVLDETKGAEVMVRAGPRDEALHCESADIKAVTLHQARFEKERDGGWVALVTFDI